MANKEYEEIFTLISEMLLGEEAQERFNLDILINRLNITSAADYDKILDISLYALDAMPTDWKYRAEVIDYAYQLYGDRALYYLANYNDEYRQAIAYHKAWKYMTEFAYPEAFDYESSKQYSLKKSV